MTKTTMEKVHKIERVLTDNVSQETAFVQDDYPYGRQLRCRKLNWLEYKPKKGFRIVYRTIDPNTCRVNDPKGSTYTDLAVLAVTAEHTDAAGAPSCVEIFYCHRDEDGLASFVAAFGPSFNEAQKGVAAAYAKIAAKIWGPASGYRFNVTDAETGEAIASLVTAKDPMFAGCTQLNEGHGLPMNWPLRSLAPTRPVGIMRSYVLGRMIRVEYVDTVSPQDAFVAAASAAPGAKTAALAGTDIAATFGIDLEPGSPASGVARR